MNEKRVIVVNETTAQKERTSWTFCNANIPTTHYCCEKKSGSSIVFLMILIMKYTGNNFVTNVRKNGSLMKATRI